MVAAARLVGGLLTGLGTGIQLDGKAKYERMLADLEHSRRLELEGVRHGNDMESRRFSADADQKGREFSAERDDAREKGRQEFTSKENEAEHGRRKDEIGFEYGQRRGLAAFEDELDDKNGGLSAEDSRLISQLEEQYSDDAGNPDYGQITEHLRDIGRNDLVSLISPSGGSSTINEDDPLWEEAGLRADAEMESKAGYFSGDESDFAADSGSRDAFRMRRQREIYGALKGEKGGAEPKGADQPDDKPADSGNTFTKAEAEATAKKYNLPVAEVIKQLEAKGWTLKG